MRLIGKLLALPFMLVTGILYLVCKFLVVLSGAVLGILSGIIFLAALVLFFVAGFLPGLAWLMIAFLISPYGLPLAAAWLVGIIGGAFTGIGMALVLKAGATTGGTDMVAAIIQSHMRHYTVVQVMQVLDAAIVILGLYVFGLRPTLYAVVSIFVSTKISDAFLEGFKTSKAAFIITNRYEEVAERLMDELDRGVTGLHAQGMYTEEKKCVLYCVVSRKEIVRVKEIVNDVDSSAFVIVSDVREVLGEGFLEYSDDF